VSKFSTPKDEKFYIGHFLSEKKKLTPKQKALREWHLHPDSKKLFINIRLAGERGLRKAVMDGVQMYFYPDKEGELFVNIDWMIERKIMGAKDSVKLQDLKIQVLEVNKPLLEEIKMDKQIKKVKVDIEKNEKSKAKKDISKLMKMDKKFDKEIDECKDMKKMKGKKK